MYSFPGAALLLITIPIHSIGRIGLKTCVSGVRAFYLVGIEKASEYKRWDVVEMAPIVIADKVWLGMNVTVLKGVTIGEGSVVAAGSIVTKNVPPWTLVAGNPARIIRELPRQ